MPSDSFTLPDVCANGQHDQPPYTPSNITGLISKWCVNVPCVRVCVCVSMGSQCQACTLYFHAPACVCVFKLGRTECPVCKTRLCFHGSCQKTLAHWGLSHFYWCSFTWRNTYFVLSLSLVLVTEGFPILESAMIQMWIHTQWLLTCQSIFRVVLCLGQRLMSKCFPNPVFLCTLV